MRYVCAWMIMLAPLAAADKASARQAPPRAIEIPAGAVETHAGTWKHTDTAGRKWIYRKTPFGVARLEDKGGDAATPSRDAAVRAVPPAEAKVKAVEEGDTIRFEKPGPFGVYRWSRQASDLSEAERGWLEASRKERSASTRD